MNVEHRIVIASPPDRKGVVAEIWHGDEMWAEVAREGARLTIEFYPNGSHGIWIFEYEEALKAIQDAKNTLFGKE